MFQKQYTLKLAGELVNCRFEFAYTANICREFAACAHTGGDAVCVSSVERDIYISQFPKEQWGPNAEYKSLIGLVSDKLMLSDRLIFHSVAFALRGRAWLLTAPSGTGKTTQYMNLKKLYGDEIRIICGDNPVLHFMQDGTIMVHPSPWKGKEKLGSNLTAPLGGVIWLKKGNENLIDPFPLDEVVFPIYNEINTYAREPEMVHRLFRLEERLITSVPVWRFQNKGDEMSSAMLYQYIKQYEGRRDCL